MNNRKLKQLVKEALSNMIDEGAPIKMVHSTKNDDKLVGTHQYGKGFIPNELGKELGFKSHPTSIPNYTKMGGDASEDPDAFLANESVPDHNFKNPTPEEGDDEETTARDFTNKATDISDDYNDITSVGLEEMNMGGGTLDKDAEILADLIDSNDMGGEEEIFPLHEFFGMDEMAKSANVYRLKPGKEAALIRLLKMTNQKLKDRTRDTGGRGNKQKSFTDDDLERIIDVISQGEFTTNDLRAAHQNTDPDLGRKKGSGPQMWNNILNKQPQVDNDEKPIPGTGGLMYFGKTDDDTSGYIELTSQLKKQMEPDTSAEPKRRGRPPAPKPPSPEDEFDAPEMAPEMAPDDDPIVQQATQAQATQTQAQAQDPKRLAVKAFMDRMKSTPSPTLKDENGEPIFILSTDNKVKDIKQYKAEFAKFKSTMNEVLNENKNKTMKPQLNEEFRRMQKLAGIITEGEYKTGLIQERDRDNAGMFMGWGDPSLGLGKDVTAEPSNLQLRSKADAGKTSLSYDVMLKSKDGSKNVQIFATVGDEPKLRYRAKGIEDDVVEKWLDKNRDNIQRYFSNMNYSKEELGKNFHIGSGYEDDVTDEDMKSIKDGISKLTSVKISKI